MFRNRMSTARQYPAHWQNLNGYQGQNLFSKCGYDQEVSSPPVLTDPSASKQRPLRILVTSWRDINHPEAGGAEVFLERVTGLLAERGHHVTVVTARYPGGLPQQARDSRLFVRAGGRYSVYPASFAHVLRRSHEYDVILDIANGVPFWTPLATRTPTVCLVHHVHREQWAEVFKAAPAKLGWWLESTVAPMIYRGCRYLAVSGATKKELESIGVDPQRIDVVYSGVDPLVAEKRLLDDHEIRFVCIGRLVPHKRIEIAIRAIATLKDEIPGLSLTIAGGGYWEENLRRTAQEYGVADRVRLAGLVSEQEKANLLADAAAHLMPSMKEGWGLVIIEAGTVGTTSVAFRAAGGTTESIRNDESGILVDSEEQFVQAVRQLALDPQLRDRLGAGAARYARDFSWSSTTDQIEEVLQSAAKRGDRSDSLIQRSREKVRRSPLNRFRLMNNQ